jgi:anti-sigma-K factor RskA
MTHETFRELLPLYVVGALDGDELREFERYVEANRERCAPEIAEFQAVADQLALAIPPVAPPASVWRQIRADVQPAPIQREPLGLAALLMRWAPWSATAALALVVLYLSNQLTARQQALVALRQLVEAQQQDIGTLQAANARLTTDKAELARVANELLEKLDRQDLRVASLERSMAVVTDPSIRVAQMADPKGETKAVGRVYWNDTKQTGLVVASHLPAVIKGEDKCLELWAIKAGEAPVPAGIFWTDETGHGVMEIQLSRQLASIDKFAVTIEPASGVPAPTGPMVLLSR